MFRLICDESVQIALEKICEDSRDRSKVCRSLAVGDCLGEEVGSHQDPPTRDMISTAHILRLELETHIFHQDSAFTTAPVAMTNSWNQSSRIDI
jgi:hypothetical protein